MNKSSHNNYARSYLIYYTKMVQDQKREFIDDTDLFETGYNMGTILDASKMLQESIDWLETKVHTSWDSLENVGIWGSVIDFARNNGY